MAKQEALDRIADLLADKISIDEFEDWSASFSWNIHKRADADTQKLAYLIRAILNSHENDETEDQLREQLALAAEPFHEIASESRVFGLERRS
jgi:hypothetical protein